MQARPHDLAYLIYTSGTTGKPKGVMVEHQGVVNRIHWMARHYGFTAQDVVLQKTTYVFDVSVWEFFLPLCFGLPEVLCPKEAVYDMAVLLEVIQSQGITTLHFVPSLLRPFLEAITPETAVKARSLRQIFASGEALPLDIVQRHRERLPLCALHNLYGPTEASVDVSYFDTAAAEDRVPIGKPIANIQLYVVDRQRALCPIGVPGELVIGGVGLARGYWNRAALTAETFVESSLPCGRVYKTGDLARWLPDGNIEYLGRLDHQVKIRGFRIELGEVETAVRACEGVADGAVWLTEQQGEKDLVAYVVPLAGATLDLEGMRSRLREQLPPHMVPSYYVELAALPLSSNGKLDRKALPKPTERLGGGGAYAAPEGETEARLAALWREVLGVKAVGREDHFFELGGHSLKATQLVSRIHKELEVELALREVFLHPRLREMAQALGTLRTKKYARIERVAEAADYALSHAQRRLWVLDQLEPGNAAYNIPGAYLMEGPLDEGALRQSLHALMARHESLRTSFLLVEGQPRQKVHPDMPLPLEVMDFAADESPEAKARAWARQEAHRPFVLSEGPLWRVKLVKLAEARHLLIFTLHHIISDGWSMAVLFREAAALYGAYAQGSGNPLAAPALQYRDYAAWQNRLLADSSQDSHRAYWLEKLKDAPAVLDLPADHPRPTVKDHLGGRLHFNLSKDVTLALASLCQHEDVTPFMAVVALVKALLYRYTAQTDLLIGSPVAGRVHPDLQDQVGFYVNTLALRDTVQGAAGFKALLAQVKQTVLGALEHQAYPFDKLVDDLRLERDTTRNPLFEVMVLWQEGIPSSPAWTGLSVQSLSSGLQRSKFDWTVGFHQGPEAVTVSLEYAAALFTPERMARVGQHLSTLLEAVLTAPEAPLDTLTILPGSESRRLLEEFNPPPSPYPRDLGILELFHRQVLRVPDAPALLHGSTVLSFRDLDRRATALAARFRQAHGIGPGDRVGILLDRSENLLAALLAVWKTGAAFIPLDTAYPRERLRLMLEDGRCKLLLTQEAYRDRVPAVEGQHTVDLAEALAAAPAAPPFDPPAYDPARPAYVLYTSGSTGTPKGVLVEMGSLAHYIHFVNTHYFTSPTQGRFGLFTSLSFDLTLTSLLSPLTRGLPLTVFGSAQEVGEILRWSFRKGSGIDSIKLTPSHISLLRYLDLGETGIEVVVAGGEALTGEQVGILKALSPSMRIYNEYGPTEATVGCMWKAVEAGEPVTLGRPMANTRIYVLDKSQGLCPLGVSGEIAIGGAGLARGYLNRPELTAEKFVADPYRPGERLYRTGDLGRWRTDGELEYLGRMDQQVKVRGHRIELGEVEAALLLESGVREAVVLALGAEGSRELVAYVAGEAEGEALGAGLRARLPEYMLPSRYVRVERLPLTPNGKVDRKALEGLDVRASARDAYEAPREGVEACLAGIWQEVLGVERVGRSDSFFALGGDSIRAIQVVSRLRQKGFKLEIRDLLTHPRIETLGTLLRAVSAETPQGPVEGPFTLGPIQRWFFDQAFPAPHHFNQSLLLFRPEGFEPFAVRQAFAALLAHHDALRVRFPRTDAGLHPTHTPFDPAAVDLFEADLDGDLDAAIAPHAAALQAGLDLEHGPLLRVGLFHESRGDHLLLVLHHLVVDGVSWRILAEDFATAYAQARDRRPVQLPAKTAAFSLWNERLAAYAHSPTFAREAAYWQALGQRAMAPLPKDHPQGTAHVSSGRTVRATLAPALTQSLLREAHQAYRTEINDLLLAAFATALGRWAHQERVLLRLEGHGREEEVGGLDVSRTVGWFTSSFPVGLLAQGETDLSTHLRRTKEALRQIPHKGIGYGLLTTLAPQALREGPALHLQPEVSFNYLGQTDQELKAGFFQASPLARGPGRAANQALEHALNLNAFVAGGALQLHLSYSAAQYGTDTVQGFLDRYCAELEAVVAHCLSVSTPCLTPSDYGAGFLGLAELETVRAQLVGEAERLYGLSPLQEGMLFHALLDTASTANVNQLSLRLRGALDPALFTRSFASLQRRHGILRTVFLHRGLPQSVQAVLAASDLEVLFEDLSHLAPEAQAQRLSARAAADRQRGFDLERGPLLRVAVARLGEAAYEVLWSHHHILMDGWCNGLLFVEFMRTYEALQAGREPVLEAVRPYEAYIQWLLHRDKAASLAYWKQYLAGYDQAASLPRRGSAEGAYRKGETAFAFTPAQTARLEQWAREHQVTLSTAVQGLWGVLVQRYSAQADVVFGAVVSGRPAELPGVERMMGLFINTVPVRVRSEAGQGYASLVRGLQAAMVASEGHAYCQLAEVQAQSALKGRLLDHVVVFENYPVEREVRQNQLASAGWRVERVEAEEQTSYDLTVIVAPGEALGFKLLYNAGVYDGAAMARIGQHLSTLLEAVLTAPEAPLDTLPILPAAERRRIMEEFNATAVEYDAEQTLVSLFEAQAARTPEALALVAGPVDFTYRDLSARINALAHHLQSAHGVGRGDRIAFLTSRSENTVIALWAILTTGAAYLPIDAALPPGRIAFLLQDGEARLLLTDGPTGLSPDAIPCPVLPLQELSLPARDPSPRQPVRAADLAYLMYTSGTTGKPKGVMVSHGNVVNFCLGMDLRVGVEPGDALLALTPVSFDISVLELCWSLVRGIQVHLGAESGATLGFERYLEAGKAGRGRRDITLFQTTPSLLKLIYEDARSRAFLEPLRALLVGGEALPQKLALDVRGVLRGRLVNMYGPTETTVWSTTGEVEEEGPIRIGRPIANTRILVVDGGGRICPIGVVGEIWIGGAGLSQGYWKREALTAEKFVADPVEAGEKMYRTGDLGRWAGDGTLECLGRTDHQVKVRGFRIELGEVEAALREVESVADAAAWVVGEGAGKELAAYLVGRSGSRLDMAAVKEHLRGRLPGAMLPSYYVALEALPYSANGKLDRKALPQPTERLGGSQEQEPPQGDAEVRLAELWEQVLGVKAVGREDHFFELGGHSLKATQLVNRIHKDLGIELSLRKVFQFPRLREMAQALGELGAFRYARIDRVVEAPYHVLSHAQRRLWVLDRLEPGSAAYNMPGAYLLEGRLDGEALRHALQSLVERHEGLRAGFILVGDGPRMKVWAEAELPWEFLDLSREQDADGKAKALAEAEAHAPFDLSRAPLLRAKLVKLAPERHLFLFTLHHIIGDAWSMGVLYRELAARYEARVRGAADPLAPLPLQYKDYAAWQNRLLEEESQDSHRAYWMEKLKDAPAALDLDADFPRPAVKSLLGDRLRFGLSQELATDFAALCRREGATPFMAAVALVKALLYRYTAQTDILVGSPVAGRVHPDLQDQVGFYANTLALRDEVRGGKGFRALLNQVKQTVLEALDHQAYPFDKLVEDLRLERDTARNPLFEVMVLWQGKAAPREGWRDLEVRPLASALQRSKFDLLVGFTQGEEGTEVSLEYATALFTPERMARLGSHLSNLLAAAVAAPDAPLDSLEILSSEERDRLLGEFHRAYAPFDAPPSVVSQFEARAERTPGALALAFGPARFTYAGLNAQANRLAAHLREACGVVPGDRVGLLIERGPWMAVSLLGILKAGAVYCPFELRNPPARLLGMIEDAGCRCLLTADAAALAVLGRVPETPIIELTRLPEGNADVPNPRLQIALDAPAYVIYTSGSTGLPKGVVCTHRCLANLLAWQAGQEDWGDGLRILQFASYGFDVSVQEALFALTSGGSLHGVEDARRLDLAALGAFLEGEGIQLATLPPSVLQVFVQVCGDREFPALRHVVVSGEALQVTSEIRSFLARRRIRLHNQYGPSETHVVTQMSLGPGELGRWARPPIGRPLPQTRLYVLDGHGRLQPIGVPGEIHLGGAHVALGYLNREALTAEKFLADPFQAGGRMYRTGDMGRWTEAGEVEYLGRNDDQVKVRGFRIELGEIEAALLRAGGVRAAHLEAPESPAGGRELVAYCVPAGGEDAAGGGAAEAAVREALVRSLPEYMVPGRFVWLERLPLTGNGKVDRKALPKPAERAADGPGHEPPRGEAEERLAALWREVLGVGAVGREDNFFALGGHSLKATHLLNRIHRDLEVELPLREVFLHPRLRELAQALGTLGTYKQERIDPAEEAPDYPLSHAQRRLWVLDQLEPGGVAYSIPGGHLLEGALDAGALRRAMQTLLERHESLRTTFTLRGGEPRQVVHAGAGLPWREIDLRDAADPRRAAADLIRREAAAPFDLAEGPLWRVKLVALGPERHALLVTMHHAISDGWSLRVLMREISILYEAYRRQDEDPLPPLRIQYKDYAAWEARQLAGKPLEAHRRYWMEKLGGELPVLDMPTDFPRPALKSSRGDRHRLDFPGAIVLRLKELVRREGATSFMACVAAVQTLLHAYTGQEDILLGSPIAGRLHEDLKHQVGVFINTLALRGGIDAGRGFADILREAKRTALDAYDHQVYPFDRLIEDLDLPRDTGRNPLFDVMVDLHVGGGQNGSGAELRISDMEAEIKTSKFDLSFEFLERGESLGLVIEYSTDLFAAATIERLGRHFVAILGQAVADPDLPVGEIDFLSKAEKREQLEGFNGARVDYPEDKTLLDLFRECVRAAPEAEAIVSDGRVLSYARLDAASDTLARRLRAGFGVGREDRVALVLDRSEWMVVGILGVLKAGAAFIPLDSALPPERIQAILEESRPRVVLYRDGAAASPGAGSVPWERIDRSASGEDAGEDGPGPDPRDAAYVIYTSGTTGRPKGVVVDHLNLANAAFAWRESYGLADLRPRLLQLAGFSFDVFVGDVARALANAGMMVICPEERRGDPEGIADLAIRHRIDILESTPALVRLIAGHLEEKGLSMPCLRLLIVGSDVLRIEEYLRIKSAFGPGVRILNSYGITEATIDTSFFEGEAGYRTRSGIVPIGKPLPNMELLVLGKGGRLLPLGAVGEIHIGGKGVARGYLGNPELTASKFLPHPFRPGSRLYRTGDLGRWLPDGNLELLGRSDNQVKIRGFRIELGEVETALAAFPSIRKAVAATVRTADGGLDLIACYCADGPVSHAELRAGLRRTLPSYMIPSRFIHLEAIPLTRNGKIDLRALPAAVPAGEDGEEPCQPPRNEVEAEMLEIWKAVLGVARMGIDHNYFEMGGNSIKALGLVAQVRKRLGIDFGLRDIYLYPTIRDLSSRPPSGLLTPSRLVIKLNASLRRDGAAFFLPPLAGHSYGYAELAQALGPGLTIYGLNCPGFDQEQPLASSIPSLAEVFLAEVKAVQPHGPYVLMGYSMAVHTVFEMAKRLEASGENVRAILIDAPPKTAAADPVPDSGGFWEQRLGDDILAVGKEELVDRLIAYLGMDASAKPYFSALSLEDILRMKGVWDNNLRICDSYVLEGTVAADLLCFEAAGNEPRFGMEAWSRHTRGSCEVHATPGSHLTMLGGAESVALAGRIREILGLVLPDSDRKDNL